MTFGRRGSPRPSKVIIEYGKRNSSIVIDGGIFVFIVIREDMGVKMDVKIFKYSEKVFLPFEKALFACILLKYHHKCSCRNKQTADDCFCARCFVKHKKGQYNAYYNAELVDGYYL